MPTAKELIEKLPLIQENILAEAALQPIRFIDAARYRVSKMVRRSQALAKLEYRKARVALFIRGDRDPEGKRVTEGHIKERIELDKKVMVLRDELDKAFAEEKLSELILEAYRQRRDAIRIMAEAQIAEGTGQLREVERIQKRKQLSEEARKLERHRREVFDE